MIPGWHSPPLWRTGPVGLGLWGDVYHVRTESSRQERVIEGSAQVTFRGNVEAEILRRITSTDAVEERALHMCKQEVEQIGREAGLSARDASRLFFLLAGEVWVGEIVGGPKHGHPAIAHMPEPEDWFGVALDVPGQGRGSRRQGQGPREGGRRFSERR
jgi:hypothetical protein